MNSKAESFKRYVEEQQPGVFQIEELEGDEQQTVIFRSTVSIQRQQLPIMVVIDSSVFSIIRVQVVPKAFADENKVELFNFINEQNLSYKPFKFFFNDLGDLMMECCLLFTGEEAKSEEVYLLFNVLINYLNENYRKIMKLIWSGPDEKDADSEANEEKGSEE